MNLDDSAQEAVRELGEAVNAAIEESPRVVLAIEVLREIGYEPKLTLRLEIGLREDAEPGERHSQEIELDLTEEDLKTLRRMKIKIE